MYFVAILAIIICILLGLIILIQNPKGGGLSTGFTGSNVMGVQRTGDFLEKGTWVLALLLVVCSLLITTLAHSNGGQSAGKSKIQEQMDKTVAPSPIAPSGAPAKKQEPAKK